MPTLSSSGGGGILPSYQRLVSGPSAQLFGRRAFRAREKYLILLVFLTFGIVCFGAFFFLPEDLRGSGGYDSVYRVYQRIQKAGPELLIPAPPRSADGESSRGLDVLHHGLPGAEDVHVLEDKQKLQAKINEEYQKTLEKPEVIQRPQVRVSSSASTPGVQQWGEIRETVPPEPADRYPLTVGGEDKDPEIRERRNKIVQKPI